MDIVITTLREMQHENKKAIFIVEKTGCDYIDALRAISKNNGNIPLAVKEIRIIQGIPYEFNDDALLCPCCQLEVDVYTK